MTQADSVYITPPTNTSAIDHPIMFPPRDPTRRRFLAGAAVASVVSAGTLAAATQAANVPQAVTVPIGPDPIHAVIEAHRKAAREHTKAIDLATAFEEAGGIHGERRREYDHLEAATDVTWWAMANAGCTLVNTRPTTLAGILALCKYIEPLFGETDQPELPEYIEYDDDTQAYIPEAFAYVIGRAVEELIKAGRHEQRAHPASGARRSARIRRFPGRYRGYACDGLDHPAAAVRRRL